MQEAAVAIPGCFLFWDTFLVPGMTGRAIQNSRFLSDTVGTFSGKRTQIIKCPWYNLDNVKIQAIILNIDSVKIGEGY